MRRNSVRLWSIEGNRQRLDGGAMFGNAPRSLWSRWLTPDGENRVELACRALLARDVEGKTVLFETGVGAFFEPKLKSRYGVFEDRHVLLDSLAACGIGHEDIDAVVLSHLHFDHAGGLLAAYSEGPGLRLLFPNARFIISSRAWNRARRPHPRDHASFIPGLAKLLSESGRLEIVEGPHTPGLGDAVRFSFSNGHTPGLMLAEIGGGVAFCGDLIPGRPWVHLPVTMGYDRYPEQLINEKQRFLEDKIARGISLFFTHDPGCALARPVREADGKYSVTAEQRVVEDLALRA
jgi:glyoxylase-like metal-dependent hydrolase (beta-lactamase superfamily II)